MKGIRIKEILMQEGYTQSQIAKLIGESPQNFSAALGVNDVRTGLVERIAKAIGKPVTFFYGIPAPAATATGENATAQAGNNNTNGTPPSVLDKALDEIAAQRRMTEKAQEQSSRLLDIIDRLSSK